MIRLIIIPIISILLLMSCDMFGEDDMDKSRMNGDWFVEQLEYPQSGMDFSVTNFMVWKIDNDTFHIERLDPAGESGSYPYSLTRSKLSIEMPGGDFTASVEFFDNEKNLLLEKIGGNESFLKELVDRFNREWADGERELAKAEEIKWIRLKKK